MCTQKLLLAVITTMATLMCAFIPIDTVQGVDTVSPTVPIVVQPETFTDVVVSDKVEVIEDAEEVKPITFKVTAYCPCERCSDGYGKMTSTGVLAKEGRTIAVDPKYIPYGTEVTINGNTYVAEDCGGAIKGNRLDIYFDNHQEAVEFGVQHLEGVVDW